MSKNQQVPDEVWIRRIEDFVYNTVVPQLCSLGYTEFKEHVYIIALSDNSKRILGLCERVRKGYSRHKAIYKLSFNKLYLNSAPEHEIKNTIAHEVCHSYSKSSGHDKAWKRITQHLNIRFGYSITSTHDTDTIKSYVDAVEQTGNVYKIVCNNCGSTVLAYRMSERLRSIIRDEHIYFCNKCNSSDLDVILPPGKDIADIDLGTPDKSASKYTIECMDCHKKWDYSRKCHVIKILNGELKGYCHCTACGSTNLKLHINH